MRKMTNYWALPFKALFLLTAAVMADSAEAQSAFVANPHPAQLSGINPLAYFASKQRAELLVATSNWAEAKPVLEQLVQAYPYDGDVWRELGTTRLHLKEYTSAAAAFVEADRRGIAVLADYNAADAARAFAATGDLTSALEWLKIALHRYTYREPSTLLAEHVFNSVRDREEFRALSGSNAIVPSGYRPMFRSS